MRTLSQDRRDLIDALVAEADIGGITAALLEKDEHLTSALHAVFELKFEHAHLVFCGGTSLSKAHGLIERMSEDADLKVVLSPETKGWTKNQVRRYLGDEVRHRVLTALASLDLAEDEKARRSLNDNRYVHSQWEYQRTYESVTALRPNLQLELVVRTPALPTQQVAIGALTDRLAGVNGPTTTVTTVCVAETLAEKVLSFLRRFAMHRSGHMKQQWDEALVRHIYDSHCILTASAKTCEEAKAAFIELVKGDVDEFGYQHPEFAQDPKKVLSHALQAAREDGQTRDEYEKVLMPLVYGKGKHPFKEAWASFEAAGHQLLKSV